jgi:hypothetical protein
MIDHTRVRQTTNVLRNRPCLTVKLPVEDSNDTVMQSLKFLKGVAFFDQLGPT